MAEDSPVTQRRHQGTSRSYILDRLKREKRTAFIDAIEAGRVTALAVAVELGWVKRPPTVGRYMNRARQRQHQLQAIAGDGLSSSQMQELWLGPGERSLFDSREELEQAWHKHRTEIMRLRGSHGRRPMGWWEFDAGDLKHPGYDRERSTLWRAGVLTADEKAELERGWRAEFDAAWKRDARARREHYRWADIPAELVKTWTAERRRRGKTIRQIEVAAAPAV